MFTITAAMIMRREIATLYEEDNLEHVDGCMRRADLRQVPVIDGKKLVGMVDERDIASSWATAGDRDAERRAARRRELTFVAEVMRRKVPTINASASALEAMSRLATYNCDTVFVVDDEQQLLGILTRKEFATLAERSLRQARRERIRAAARRWNTPATQSAPPQSSRRPIVAAAPFGRMAS